MCGNRWLWRKEAGGNNLAVKTRKREALGGVYAKGRPRKPLAEVLLGAPRCAPLRLLFHSAHGVPFLSCSKYEIAEGAAL